jgi:hypothetical protein
VARRKAERPTERGERRAETNAVAAYLTALRAPKVPARSRDALEKRRAQIEQWIAEESSPIRQVELIQQRLNIDAELAQIDQAAQLRELEEAFVNVAASWASAPGSVLLRCVRWAYGPACSDVQASSDERRTSQLSGVPVTRLRGSTQSGGSI